MSDPRRPSGERGLFARKRTRIALAIAGVEALVVAFGSVSRWVVIIASLPVIGFYFVKGREWKPGFGRDTAWVAATAQALAIVIAVVAFYLGLLTLIVAATFGVIALFLLLRAPPS